MLFSAGQVGLAAEAASPGSGRDAQGFAQK